MKPPIALADIPGLPEALAAARAEEERIRELAFLPVHLEIGGIPVEQYRPRHRQLLLACGSPFLCGGAVRAEDVVQALWILRVPDPQETRDAFAAALADFPAAELVAGLERYLDEARIDAPGSGTGDRAPVTSFTAQLVHEFATAYGWTPAQTLDTPFAQLYQLFRLVCLEENPKLVFLNRLTMRAEKAALKAYDEAQAREEASA